MAKLQTENLFLLEFLVDEMNMEKRCDCVNPGELCVSFQFLDNEALDVCEGDFNCDKKFADTTTSKTGKSCLFSLTPAQAQKVSVSFDVIVNVFKKMQPGWQPDRSCVGVAKVPILSLFKELVSAAEVANSAKVLQDTFPITDNKGMIVGRIGVYIRLSCYGKMIITQFQMNMDDKSVLFKDKDGRSLYRYKRSKRGRTTKIEDVSQKNQPDPCLQSPPCLQPQAGYDPQQMMTFGQGQFPPPNLSCPMQPCFPQNQPAFPQNQQTFPQNQQAFPPPNLNCPMQPCFPPPNLNSPMQPCFPDYGASMMDMAACPAPSRACQQVSFAATQKPKAGCGGGCGRC